MMNRRIKSYDGAVVRGVVDRRPEQKPRPPRPGIGSRRFEILLPPAQSQGKPVLCLPARVERPRLFVCRKEIGPATGSVVNEWGRCHDIKNLFIVDGSIWVTSGGVSPTSTIRALALYIAGSIKQRLGTLFD
jgi:hypothetical protein